MSRIVFVLLGAALLAAPSLRAQTRGDRDAIGGARSSSAVRSQVFGNRAVRPSLYRRGLGFADFRSNRYRGRYYYYSGVPYFFPYYDYGFGYPYYYGNSFGFSYYGGSSYGAPYPYYEEAPGYAPYEGRIVPETAPGNFKEAAPSLNGARSLPAAVQRQLAERGYYKGGIDGQFGPASKSALRRFQRDKGLNQTGLIDDATLNAMGFSSR